MDNNKMTNQTELTSQERRPGPRPQPGPGPRPGEGSGARPTGPPPSHAPQRNIQTFRVDAPSIQNCMFRFTYIWQTNGDEYWMFPTFLTSNTISGFRWNNRFGWSYFGVSLRHITSFTCR